MLSDYQSYINEKVLEYLPTDRMKAGDSIAIRCPFCGDSKKSSLKKRGYYTPSKGLYHCFNCDVSMSAMKLLEALSGNDYESIRKEYLKLRSRNAGRGTTESKVVLDEDSELKMSDPNHLESRIPAEWKHPLTEVAKKYLDGRMVSSAPFLKEPLYTAYDSKKREYILIPWRINGVDCYYQYNDFLKNNPDGMKYVFPSKLTKAVYGLDNIDLAFPYIICFEGVYDSLFVKNGICIGGKSLTDFQQQLISMRYPRHKIVIAFDNDKAGMDATRRMIERTGSRYKYFKWFGNDETAKDINDYVKKVGNPNVFADRKTIEKGIMSSLEMKLVLAKLSTKNASV